MNEELEIIVISGASRSGTTMMSRILGGNPKVLTFKELHYFGDICAISEIDLPRYDDQLVSIGGELISRHRRGIWGGKADLEDISTSKTWVKDLEQGDRSGIGVYKQFIKNIVKKENKEIACEQTPRNIFYARKLLKLLPKAKFVHIVRDPRAVLASQKKRWRHRIMEAKNVPISESIRVWFNYHPFTTSRLWVKAVNIALDLEKDPRFYVVRFEDIVSDPECEIKKICRFASIEYESAMLDVPQNYSSHRPAVPNKTGVAMDVLALWEGVLTQAELYACESIAKKQMKLFEYEKQSEGGFPILSYFLLALRYPVHLIGVIVSNPRRAWIQLVAILDNK